MQFTVYGNTGKSAVYPLLLDVTSDIIGQLNRRIVIPLLPVEKYPAGHRPDRLVPVVRLTDGKEYAVMTHELASIPVRALGTVFCDAAQYRSQVKAAIDSSLMAFSRDCREPVPVRLSCGTETSRGSSHQTEREHCFASPS